MTFPNGGERDELHPNRQVSLGRFTREDNMRLDKEYGTDPRSPLHTNNRFPSADRYSDLEKSLGSRFVLKDFPDSLVDQAARAGSADMLHEWLSKGNRPRTENL